MNRDKEITPMLVFAIFSAVLGMFQFGFNTGVINAPQKVLEEFIAQVHKNKSGNWMSEETRDLIWSIVVSVFAVGGMVGGLIAPMVSNWCGRKTGLVLNNAIAVLGVTLMSSSQMTQSIESLIVGRFFIGVNCGLNTALVPMYLSEIASVSFRGALGTVSQLGVTVGLLFSQVLGLKDILGNKEYWPFLFGFAFVPAILQLIMLPFCPESPRYLLLNCGRVSEARLALRRLRNSSDIEEDVEEMRAEERAQDEEVRKYGKLSSIRELFNHPWLRTPLIIGIMMQLSQQLSGINAIFYYSTNIFLAAEVPADHAVYATMGVGATMVIMTLVSMPLMDRLGRRTLHLYGLAGMFLASIFLTISLLVKFLYDWMKYISVISILFYTLFFGIGPGSIPLMITTELFTQGSRPTAMSVSVLVNWFTNFVVGLTFPFMMRLLQNYLFLPFTVFLAIFWIFTYKKLPETKNRTFEEIAALFKPNLDPSSPMRYPDYGCTTLAGLGVMQAQTMNHHGRAEGESPLNPEDSSSLAANKSGGHLSQQHRPGDSSGGSYGATSAAYKTNRFRFDAAAIDSLRSTTSMMTNGKNLMHQHQIVGLNGAGGRCNHHSHNLQHQQLSNGNSNRQAHIRGSQGNLHHNQHLLPHHSSGSIAQNLSTSDQQPLIVDTKSDHRCHCLHSQNSISSNHCCSLKTTSFMDHPASVPYCDRCTCFEQGRGSAGRSSLGKTFDDLYNSSSSRTNRMGVKRDESAYLDSGGFHDHNDDDDEVEAEEDSDRGGGDDVVAAAPNGFDGAKSVRDLDIDVDIDDDDDDDDDDEAIDIDDMNDDNNNIKANSIDQKPTTLTRVYKPLNDLRFPTASASNMVDEFYILPT